MADLRLTAQRLAAVRKLAENPVSRRALWALVSRDFNIAELEALPPSERGRVEEVPRPVQGKAPRHWGDGADLGAPASPRCTGARIRAAYAAGDLSPVEVLDELFRREDDGDFGPSTYSPFVALDREGARTAAEASAQRYRDDAALSALDGIPVPIKDQMHMSGLPTRGGTTWRTALATEDSAVVARLRNAGAVLPGKAHATENGLNPLGYNPNFFYPRNVYSDGHGAGGSSTGSAVAVGLGFSPVAVSTDGGGSIRVPAALNGLFGLKPTFNRFSRYGDVWYGTVGHTGPIGASSSDLVDLMEVCSGRDERDPLTHFAPDWGHVEATWRPALGRGIRGCRIGVLRAELRDAHPGIARACEEALRALEKDGAVLIDVNIPLLRVANAIGPLVIAGESAANASDDLAAHREHISDELRLIYGLLANVTAQQHLRGLRTRTRLREVMAAAIADVDLLALPAHARLAAPYPLTEDQVQVADTAWTASMTRFNFVANLTGLPAAAVPVGMCEGLPVALQLIGDAWDEASVLAGCAHLERLEVTALPVSPGYRAFT
ncbi:MAG: amidase [Myxococcota bacterium]